MKVKRLLHVWAVLALLISLCLGLVSVSRASNEPETNAPTGTAFTYQGQLRDGSGPVNDTCNLQFTLWDAREGGAQVGGTIFLEDVVLVEGLFTARLDFGGAAFRGQARYLEASASCPAGSGYVPLPRQELTGSPYALWALGAPWTGLVGVPADLADGDQDTTYGAGMGLTLSGGQFRVNFAGSGAAVTASRSDHQHDAAYWSLSGNAGATPGTNYLGTSDNAALELRVNGVRALRLEPASSPNLLGGYSGNQLTAGVTGATVSGGGSSGNANRVTDSWGTVGGGTNNRAGDNTGTVDDALFATVGGGYGNTAGKDWATVGGGYSNSVIGVFGTVGGGEQNQANGERSTVGGGYENTASGRDATIGGGRGNTASGNGAVIAGGGSGTYNPSTASGEYSTIGGGIWNTASGDLSTIAGGYNLRATGWMSTVGGGSNNEASEQAATVSGGMSNLASGGQAIVGGGADNIASGLRSTVGGGWLNSTSGEHATVGGGRDNVASATAATVAGGDTNTASGWRSMVPGGVGNTAAGEHSFAAGRRAKALHNGAFVWADSHDADFTSDAANEFLVRAYNGVKIVRGASTYSASQAALQVDQAAAAEAAWLYTAHADNSFAVLKVAKLPAAPGNFVDGVDRTNTGVETRRFHIDKNGTYTAGSDFAEAMPVAGDHASFEPGDVLVLSLDQPGAVEKCHQPYDGLVVGVYSTRPGFLGADKEGISEVAADEVPVAVLGIVPVKVTDENGPIQPGDLLTTSSTPGHAMRCAGLELCFGRTLGKTLEGLPAGQHIGVIRMLVSLQ
jgi:hypothetical protein